MRSNSEQAGHANGGNYLSGLRGILQQYPEIQAEQRPMPGNGIMKVRELIKMLEKHRWEQVRMRGGHRQFRHPEKTGTVTMAKGKRGYSAGYLGKHPQTGWSKIGARYLS